MRRSLACIMAVALAAAAPAAAQEFGADSPQALALREAYLRAGLALPLTSFPASLRQLREAGAAVGYVPELAAVPEADPRKSPPRLTLQGELATPVDPPPGCRLNGRCPLATEICGEVAPDLVDRGSEHFVACHNV